MDLERRVELLEKTVQNLQQLVNELKRTYFERVVTIDQQQALFQQFDERISKLEQTVQQIAQLLV